MNFTTSQKSAELAIHEGYVYRRGGKNKNGVSWRCNEALCKGRINILQEEIKVKNEHCHGPSSDRLNARNLRRMLKSELSYLTTSPLGENSRSNSSWRVLLISIAKCNQENGQPHPSNDHFHLPTPKTLTDVADIPESFKTNHGVEEFLYYDGRTTPEQETRNLFQIIQGTEFEPILCHN